MWKQVCTIVPIACIVAGSAGMAGSMAGDSEFSRAATRAVGLRQPAVSCQRGDQDADATLTLTDPEVVPPTPEGGACGQLVPPWDETPVDEAILQITENGFGDAYDILIGPSEGGAEAVPPDASLCVFGRQIELRAGYVYATGSFSPDGGEEAPEPAPNGGQPDGSIQPAPEVPRDVEPAQEAWLPPWPIVVTGMVAVGAEGTKFIVHVGENGAQQVIRLAEGGGTVYVWTDAQNFRVLADAATAMVEYTPQGGLSQARPVDTGLLDFINYVKCRAATHGLQ